MKYKTYFTFQKLFLKVTKIFCLSALKNEVYNILNFGQKAIEINFKAFFFSPQSFKSTISFWLCPEGGENFGFVVV